MTSSTVKHYIQLANRRSEAVVKGQVVDGNFYARNSANKKVMDLGDLIRATSIIVRAKAMHFRDGKDPVVSYNPNSKTFKRMIEKARGHDMKYAFGFEWILEINKIQYGYFLTVGMAQRTGVMIQYTYDRPVILTSELLEYKDHQWYAPTVWLNGRISYKPLPAMSEFADNDE